MLVELPRSGRTDPAGDLLRWIRHDALPFWAHAGVNDRSGLFHERLLPDGSPDIGAPLRIRVQFRQIYAFSHAAALGWYPQGAELALSAWQKVLRAAFERDGQPGFAHLLSPEGFVADARRDSYDHAFAVLAAAWLYRATGDASVRVVLERLIAFVEQFLTDEYGALRNIPHDLPNRQNPQMHWFEAMLALMETGSACFGAERARKHRQLAESLLFDAETGMLGEYYAQDWKPHAGELGQVVEPGHFFEWVWLLHKHSQLTGDSPGELPARIMQAGLQYRCRRTGLLVDEARRDGTVKKGTRRLWLQTELLKAQLAQFEAGIAPSHEAALSCLQALDHHYLRRPFAEGWIDQLDDQAGSLGGPVPAGILYHIFVALSEVERVLLRPTKSFGNSLQDLQTLAG